MGAITAIEKGLAEGRGALQGGHRDDQGKTSSGVLSSLRRGGIALSGGKKGIGDTAF